MKARSTHAGPPVRTSSPLLKRCLRSGSGRRGGGSLGRIGEAGHRRRLGHIITVSLSPCTVVVMVADAQLQRRRHVSYQHVKSAPAVVVARWQCLDTVCGVGVEHTQQ
ncbi:hypothetical protein CHLRE_06g267476v5 [Chlamydomonas reinhardtii]|uniref:Uncharacterized protein n=1 Tax=Chlamydomonas reinhardtii TaxID=3055 RepID=A0A2K3DN35_CHLRE|nr:uncharacterized protein CHLRE_06g267476v5 [Chlamydomonas reinhardtii]PNW81945.1 hypothetical protein CHLRE_06g267476v5 [Chlamydomonas reinhardtii]